MSNGEYLNTSPTGGYSDYLDRYGYGQYGSAPISLSKTLDLETTEIAKSSIKSHPIKDENTVKESIVKVCYNDGRVVPMRVSDFSESMQGHNKAVFANCQVYFPREHVISVLNKDGDVVNRVSGSHADKSRSLIFTSNIDPLGEELDLEEDPAPTKEDSKKPTLTFDQIQAVLSNPRDYWKGEEIDVSVFDLLLSTIVTEPEQFDELFTVEDNIPESPLLRSYIEKLAELVSVQLSKEQLKDNFLTTLGKEAYDYAGYKGKELDVVIEEAKDYHSYFKFLISKGDHVIVGEDMRNLAYKLKKNLEEDRWFNKHPIGKKTKNVIVCQEIAPITENALTITIPILKKNGSTIVAYYFTGDLDHELKDFNFDSKNLNLRLAMMNELLLKKYAETAKLKIETYVVVCDKNANYTTVTVKSNTMNRWRKEFHSYIVALGEIIGNRNNLLPYGAITEI